ncbi:C6 finger domain-containing protein [Colletotrichum camelliae]|nr:C6 finger domain-containing protein [Colletotrichum camelliae]
MSALSPPNDFGSSRDASLRSPRTSEGLPNHVLSVESTHQDVWQGDEGARDDYTYLATASESIFQDYSADWLAELTETLLPDHDVLPEQYHESPPATPRLVFRRRRSKKEHMRLENTKRNKGQNTSSPSPSSALSGAMLGPWSRFEEVDTWKYCANEMLSYISLYAKTGSTPMMVAEPQIPPLLDPVLGKVLGVCAAHETLSESHGHLVDQLLDRELQDLVNSSTLASDYEITGQRRDLCSIMRENVARLQALIMYQIIQRFSNKTGDAQKAMAQEALFVSWTRELELQAQLLQQLPSSSGIFDTASASYTDHTGLLEAAYRTIIMSYEVRAVYWVLNHKICPVWQDLFAIVVPKSLSGRNKLLYPEYVVEWEKGLIPAVSKDDERLQNLIVAACKGVDAVRRAEA